MFTQEFLPAASVRVKEKTGKKVWRPQCVARGQVKHGAPRRCLLLRCQRAFAPMSKCWRRESTTPPHARSLLRVRGTTDPAQRREHRAVPGPARTRAGSALSYFTRSAPSCPWAIAAGQVPAAGVLPRGALPPSCHPAPSLPPVAGALLAWSAGDTRRPARPLPGRGAQWSGRGYSEIAGRGSSRIWKIMSFCTWLSNAFKLLSGEG